MLSSVAAPAQENTTQANEIARRLDSWRSIQGKREAVLGLPEASLMHEQFEGREILFHVAPNVPAPGNRALVVVLHGGMGNANQIHSVIGTELDDAADEGGFIVAYLNGSRASGRLKQQFHAWNAGGGCCGLPFKTNVDDVGYVTRAVKYLSGRYGVDQRRVFAIGHSNGAMMVQRLMCETDLFQAAIPISGPLNTESTFCPSAKGKRVLAIHGTADENVPIEGEYGRKGVTDVRYKSEMHAKQVFEKSGAKYTVYTVEGAGHELKDIMRVLYGRDHQRLGRTTMLFFGLAPK